MAITRISDMVTYPEFSEAITKRITDSNALIKSGAVSAGDAEINQLVQSAASVLQMPFFKDLGTTPANVSTDLDTDVASPQKIVQGADQAVKHMLNQGWSVANLTKALTQKDPMQAVADQVGDYWSGELNRRAIASLRGVLADNVANDSGDMAYNVTLGTAPAIGAAAAANRFNGSNVIMAQQTMGDALGQLVAIAMHSVTYSYLQQQDLISTVKPSDGGAPVDYYQGKVVIVDDAMPVIINANPALSPEYVTALLGVGAMAYGEGRPAIPEQYEDKPSGGNGEGVQTLWSRKHFAIHPRGIKFTKSSQAGLSPTLTELALAANWDRVYSRKQVRIAFLRHY